jgi:hypothetical protein
LERFIDESETRLRLHELALAHRDGVLRLHATDSEHFAIQKVEVSDEELETMASMLNAAGFDPTNSAVMITKTVYKALRKMKAPFNVFCLERVGEAWFLKEYSGALHPVRIEKEPKQVTFLERILREEWDRANLALVRFKPSHLAECLGAIHQEDDIGSMPAFELPLDDRKPIILRKGGNVAVLMPIRSEEKTPIDLVVELCSQCVVRGNAGSGLAAEVLRILKREIPESAASGQ